MYVNAFCRGRLTPAIREAVMIVSALLLACFACLLAVLEPIAHTSTYCNLLYHNTTNNTCSFRVYQERGGYIRVHTLFFYSYNHNQTNEINP